MPKDATKNVDRYKVRGGQLNEFEFNQSQEEFAERPANRPQKAKKATKGTKDMKDATGASPKKLAARKTAKKK